MYGLNRYSENVFMQVVIAAIMETAVELEKEDHVAAKATGLSLPRGRNIYRYAKGGDDLFIQTREEDICGELKAERGQTVLYIWNQDWGFLGKVDSRMAVPAVTKLRESCPQLVDTRGRLIVSITIQYSFCVLMRESRDPRVRAKASAMIKRVRDKLERLIRSPFEQTKPKRSPQNGASDKGGQKKPRRQRPRKNRKRKSGRPVGVPMGKQRPASGADGLAFLKDYGKKRVASKQEAAVDQPQETPVVEEQSSPPADEAIIETEVGETQPVNDVAEVAEEVEEVPFVSETPAEVKAEETSDQPVVNRDGPIAPEHLGKTASQLIGLGYRTSLVRAKLKADKKKAEEEAKLKAAA